MEKESNNLENIRHSLAHLLAKSIIELYPGAQNAIGPAIENGFYQDFDLPEPISEADFPKIEAKMREIMPTWKKFERKEVSPEEAKKIYSWNKYKCELIDDFAKEGKTITLYTSGNFIDLCKGGHTDTMEGIDPKAFKLERIAGAYWRGDEKNKMLARIYGLAFHTKKELEEHLKMLEEAKKRDHKKLGPELDLFVFSDLVGAGLPLWTPKGTILRNTLDNAVWELRKKYGYQKVEIPHITKKDLYEISGHWAKFKDELFTITTREKHLFAMKPMNCPHHTQIYARKQWSYRDLPQRYANTTMCYRDEQTGELSGLSRTRSFAQDDAHVFCRMSQVQQELQNIWDIVHAFYKMCDLTLKLRLSLHDPKHSEKYLGDNARWLAAKDILRQIAKNNKTEYFEAPGEAAFYGPKLDFIATDSIGREWQVATIQLDMSMPESFDLACINEKSEKERIVMLHAAIMGSIERFLSIIIEHYAGAFPFWLSPVQVMILPINDKNNDYIDSVTKVLQEKNIRFEVDGRNESIGKKIREAEMQKTPFILVVGDKEAEAKTIAVRQRGKGDLGSLSLEEAISTMLG